MELPVSITTLAIAYVIVVIGAMLQGSIGFGLGTFAVPLLILIDPIFVPAPLMCLAFLLTILVYHRNRHDVRHQDLVWGVTGRVIGAILGGVILVLLPAEYFSLFVGCMVFFAVGLIYRGHRLPLTRTNLVAAGTISGLMGTTSSVGGPPMAMLYYDREGPQIRGTLSGIFVFGVVAALISLAIVGRLGRDEVVLAISLLPALLIGYWISKYSARFLDRGYIRPTILIVSSTAAAITILRYVF